MATRGPWPYTDPPRPWTFDKCKHWLLEICGNGWGYEVMQWVIHIYKLKCQCDIEPTHRDCCDSAKTFQIPQVR